MKNNIKSLVLILCMVMPVYPLEQIAIVFIVDQLSYSALKKVQPFLQGGIKELLDNGVIYTDAHFNHAHTSTGPGHATLNTGVYNHGIIGNYWYNKEGKKIACDYDTPDRAAQFLYAHPKKGKSPRNLATDGISDQVMLASTTIAQNLVAAVSLKSRAAIFSAGRLGKAAWFETELGAFTSSKAYFRHLPSWIQEFNQMSNMQSTNALFWKPIYSLGSAAYAMAKRDYSAARLPSIINKKLTHEFFKQDKHKEHHHPYNFISYSPQSNKLLLDLAEQYLKKALPQNPHKILLWISMSSLDKIGHIYGPDSLEYIDTIYHIDTYLQSFMNRIKNSISPTKITFAFTADHGSAPLVELLQKEQFTLAYRLFTNKIQDELNDILEDRFGVPSSIQGIDGSSIYLNHKNLEPLTTVQKRRLIDAIKSHMQKQEGVKQVWTYEELENQNPAPTDIASFFKNQLFPGRTASILYQTLPYTYMTTDKVGTGHVSCYDYTTHVPLVIYQPVQEKRRTINKRVSMTQFAPTIAEKLSIDKPSACLDNVLPE